MRPILIVDGSKDSRLRLIKILSEAGYEPVESETEASALEIAHRVRPALIFIAIVIPNSNGLRVAARLRALVGFEAVPIILLGCLPPLGLADEPLASLVNGYLSLGSSPDEVLACVNTQLQKDSIACRAAMTQLSADRQSQPK